MRKARTSHSLYAEVVAVSDFGAPAISSSSFRLSAFKLTLSSLGARFDKNQTTKPVPTR